MNELETWPDDCVDEIVTSIPFSDHYEYSPNYNDFGHNHGDEGFFKQFEFLVPQLYRVLKPGRVACIHTKDRIQYGKMTGTGMYSVNEFSDLTVAAFKKQPGFVYMGRIVIDTDVVRENSQTYRLGHTQNSLDSTKMGCGSTEFVLLFRKWSLACIVTFGARLRESRLPGREGPAWQGKCGGQASENVGRGRSARKRE